MKDKPFPHTSSLEAPTVTRVWSLILEVFYTCLRMCASVQRAPLSGAGFDTCYLVLHEDQKVQAKMAEEARPRASGIAHAAFLSPSPVQPEAISSSRNAGCILFQALTLPSASLHGALRGRPLPSPFCSSCCLSGLFAPLFWWSSSVHRSFLRSATRPGVSPVLCLFFFSFTHH